MFAKMKAKRELEERSATSKQKTDSGNGDTASTAAHSPTGSPSRPGTLHPTTSPIISSDGVAAAPTVVEATPPLQGEAGDANGKNDVRLAEEALQMRSTSPLQPASIATAAPLSAQLRHAATEPTSDDPPGNNAIGVQPASHGTVHALTPTACVVQPSAPTSSSESEQLTPDDSHGEGVDAVPSELVAQLTNGPLEPAASTTTPAADAEVAVVVEGHPTAEPNALMHHTPPEEETDTVSKAEVRLRIASEEHAEEAADAPSDAKADPQPEESEANDPSPEAATTAEVPPLLAEAAAAEAAPVLESTVVAEAAELDHEEVVDTTPATPVSSTTGDSLPSQQRTSTDVDDLGAVQPILEAGAPSADPNAGQSADDADDDDLMAELEAELNAPDTPTQPAVAETTADSLGRKNPFADPVQVLASTYEPEIVPGPIPTGSISVAEYDRVQSDLMAVRQQRDELQVKNAALEKQVEAQQQNKAGRGLLGRFRKDKGDKDKGGGDKTDKSVAIASSTDAAELAVLREKVSQLKAEIVLHKETKDQLATDLRSAMADFDDQRATIGSTIATLTSENASLKARQKVREARVANGEADTDSEDERERISVDAAEASLRIELHRQVQYLETKCSRAEADAKNHARERELLKADLAKAEVLAASLTSERATLQSDKVRLNNELSGLISEGHTTSSRLRLAEDEAANLRVRIAECEAALETETKSTSRAIDRALDAEGTVALVRSDHKQAQIALTQAKAEVALAAATSSSVIEGLRTTNAELSQKLSEHEAKVSVKENRLAALASRLAHGEGDRNVLASGGTPPSMSPVDATDQSGVDTMNRKLSGSLGLIESRILEANRDRDAMSAKLVEQLEARTLFDARIAEVRAQLDEVTDARDALVQENRIVVDGNTKMSGALAATESALERERARAASAETGQGSLTTRVHVSERLAAESAEKIVNLEQTLADLSGTKAKLEAAVAEASERHRTAAIAAEVQSSDLADRIKTLESESAAASKEVARLKQMLSDAEAQRGLDQKVSTKMIKDLSKQLQKQKPTKSGGRAPTTPSPNPGRRRNVGASDHRRSASTGLVNPLDTADAAAPSLVTRPTNPGTAPMGSPALAPRQAKLEMRRSSSPAATHGDAAGADSRGRRESAIGGSALAGCTSCRKLVRKVDFYESHVKEMTDDLSKKTQLIHTFLLREKSGQLMPASKLPPPSPPRLLSFARNPSSQLTAEANRKLQQVTEDTLLQNIHLRESLDVMSDQIAQLQLKRDP